MSKKVSKLAELSLLTAVALIVFVVELQIPNPFPIPGVKLGLANIITVYAVYHYRWYEVFSVVLVRVALGSLFSGNITALIYSLSGSILCLLGMLALRRFIEEKFIPLASVFGALLHNTGQMAAALIVMQTPQILAYYPFLIVSGCLSGLFTGFLAKFVTDRVRKIKKERL